MVVGNCPFSDKKCASISQNFVENYSSLHCFSFDSQSNHPETLRGEAQNDARTRQEPTIEFHTNDTMNLVQNAIEIRGLAQVV